MAQNFFGPQIENPRYDGGLGQLMLGDGTGGFRVVPPLESGIVIPGDAKSASVADLLGRGKPDIVVTINNGATVTLENRAPGRWLRVSLPPQCSAGALVTLARAGQPDQRVEIHAGSGYLAQEPAAAWFGLGRSDAGGVVRVAWPNGSRSEQPFDGKTPQLKMPAPATPATPASGAK